MAPFGVRQFRRLLPGCVAINVVGFILVSMGNALAGHFLGESALAGVSLASPILTFGIFLMSLVGAGTGINYALRRGALDREGATRIFMQGVWTALALGVGVALAVWFARDAYIGLMTTDAEIFSNAVEYWRWLPIGVAFFCVTGLFLNCCYCDGDTVFATVVYCVQCLLSLLVTTVGLVRGYGAASCSLGFAVGYVCSCALLALHFFRKSNTFVFRWEFAAREIPVILRTSAGDALGFLGDAIVYAVLGFVISRSFGPKVLVGLPVFILVSELLSYTNGFSSAMQPIIAVYFGEGNQRSVRRTASSIVRLLAVVSAAVTALLLLFPDLALAVVGIGRSETLPLMRYVVRATALMVLPLTLMNLLNNYYQLVGREKLAVGMTLCYWMALPITLLCLFPVFGERGFWFWSVVSRWGGAALFALFVIWRYGRDRYPLLLDRERESAIETFDLVLGEMEIAVTAETVARRLETFGVRHEKAMRARLLVEESLMVIKERNAGCRVSAEVTLDLNDGVLLTLRDDGVIFDITDADAKVNGLRTFLVATMMQHQSEKSNILTTGFNRNVFRL